MATEPLIPGEEESQPSPKKRKLPGLPKLPRIPLPRIDPTSVVILVILAGGSGLTAYLGTRFAMPQRVVVEAPSEEGQERGRVFNPPGLVDFTTGPNVPTSFNTTIERPVVADSSYVHPQATLVGFVSLDARVFVAPQAAIRADVGQNVRIEEESNVQPGAVIQGEATEEKGRPSLKNQVVVNGNAYSVYLGRRVSVAAHAQVHGPAMVGEDVFVGMQALVQHARIGKGSIIAPRAAVIGVVVPEGRYVPVGAVITKQADADALPGKDQAGGYLQMHRNLVTHSVELAAGYLALHTPGGKGVGHARPFDKDYWAPKNVKNH